MLRKGPQLFTVRIKNNNILTNDGLSLALTNKLHMSNIFKWFNVNSGMPAKVEIDVSSRHACDNLTSIVWFIHHHPFLLRSRHNLHAENITIVGWHKPSFYALVHLAYAYSNFSEFHSPPAKADLIFGEVANVFACKFAIGYVLETILQMGCQASVSIDHLATQIFDLL